MIGVPVRKFNVYVVATRILVTWLFIGPIAIPTSFFADAGIQHPTLIPPKIRVIFSVFIRPLFMGAESCEKSESFLATFGPKLWSIALFVHARYGAMKVLCTGLVECGGVFGSKFKSSGQPHARPKNRSPSPARSTWHAAHNAKRPARPTNQYVWHSI